MSFQGSLNDCFADAMSQALRAEEVGVLVERVGRALRVGIDAAAEDVVDPAVVVAVEADEDVALRVGAREADDELHGLRAGEQVAHLLGGRHVLR